ncbi:hypothetical protein ACOMHN_059201 [Nucella lapillus]
MVFTASWMLKCVLVFSLSSLCVRGRSAGVSVRCGECEESRCPGVHYCPKGREVKDPCGCCTHCNDTTSSPHHGYPLNDEGVDQDVEGNACAKVHCPKFKVCMENMQGLPLCTCPGPFICKQRRSRQRPVCGTDGVTYQSRCYLRIAACNAASRIQVARRGPCTGAESARPRACDSAKSCRRRKNQTPVCGTDGKTYPSRCHMKIVACQKGVKIKMKHHDRCGAIPPGAVSPGRGPLSDQRGLSTASPARRVDGLADRKERRRGRKKKGGSDVAGGENRKRRKQQRRDKRKKRQKRRKRRKTRGHSRQRRYKMDRRQVLRNIGPNNWK